MAKPHMVRIADDLWTTLEAEAQEQRRSVANLIDVLLREATQK